MKRENYNYFFLFLFFTFSFFVSNSLSFLNAALIDSSISASILSTSKVNVFGFYSFFENFQKNLCFFFTFNSSTTTVAVAFFPSNDNNFYKIKSKSVVCSLLLLTLRLFSFFSSMRLLNSTAVSFSNCSSSLETLTIIK